MSKLYIDHQTDNRIILAVDHGGKHWEIDVTIDPDDDDGINVIWAIPFFARHALLAGRKSTRTSHKTTARRVEP